MLGSLSETDRFQTTRGKTYAFGLAVVEQGTERAKPTPSSTSIGYDIRKFCVAWFFQFYIGWFRLIDSSAVVLLYVLSLFFVVLATDKRHLTCCCYTWVSMLSLFPVVLVGRDAFELGGVPRRVGRERGV
ncbi:MAG: hypothetical protein H7839_06060 [Magnetococcus sp. YQC-5]